MFGELLPVDAIARAERLASETGLLVVVGSSLEVWPVAGLPGETVAAGGSLAILNRDPTPFDELATLVVRDAAPVRSLSRGCSVRRGRGMTGPMATKEKPTQDVIGRLAARGEEALNRLAELPGGTTALEAFNDLRQRVDDLSSARCAASTRSSSASRSSRRSSPRSSGRRSRRPKAPNRKAAP